jgi:alpha-L-fucosidase
MRALGIAAVLHASFVQPSLAVGPRDKPDVGQLALMERGYGMFISFGVNTFNQIEWSDGKLPASSYHPTALDVDQWVQTAREAGFRYILLITKHHDGFCLWDSKYTDYDVASSPVKTDIVSEAAKACKKYGVELGLYYSLWDRNAPSYKDKDPRKYVEYMKSQITELLSDYGPVCELWFDGGWDKADGDWNIPEVYEHIKKLQPNCQVTVNHTIPIPGVEPKRPKLPEDYCEGDLVRYWPVDFRTKDPDLVRADDPKHYTAPDGKLHYLPFEHTICISDRWNWFQKRDVIPARSPDELEELFYWGTSNGNALLVNLPPDQTGRIRENEREAIFKTADLLGIRGGGKPLPAPFINQAAGVKAEADSVYSENFGPEKAVDGSLERTRWAAKDNTACLTLSSDKPFVFNRIAIHEHAEMTDLGDNFSKLRKFRAEGYIVEGLQKGTWETIHQGKTIGPALVIRLPKKLTADKLRLRVTQASAPPSIHHISVSDCSERRSRDSNSMGR